MNPDYGDAILKSRCCFRVVKSINSGAIIMSLHVVKDLKWLAAQAISYSNAKQISGEAKIASDLLQISNTFFKKSPLDLRIR